MKAVLKAEGLRKQFQIGSETIEVLQGLDLSLDAGSSLSIRGESGSGKTTLLNILSGLERPDEGRVRWDGQAVEGLGNHQLARLRSRFCGMVFQSYHLVPELNALENVLLVARLARRPRQPARKRAEELMSRVGLARRLSSLPSMLSGGERQRVAVARALINEPAVVFADEPTGNLDEHSSDEVMNLLLEVTRGEGASLVLVTHNREHARRTARQTVLREGRLHVEA